MKPALTQEILDDDALLAEHFPSIYKRSTSGHFLALIADDPSNTSARVYIYDSSKHDEFRRLFVLHYLDNRFASCRIDEFLCLNRFQLVPFQGDDLRETWDATFPTELVMSDPHRFAVLMPARWKQEAKVIARYRLRLAAMMNQTCSLLDTSTELRPEALEFPPPSANSTLQTDESLTDSKSEFDEPLSGEDVE